MATKNDVTGDSIQTRANSEQYKNNWDAIFGTKNRSKSEEQPTQDNKENILETNKEGLTFGEYFKAVESLSMSNGFKQGDAIRMRYDIEQSFLCEESVRECFHNVFCVE